MTQYTPPGNYAPASLPYQVFDHQAAADQNHLRLLSIFHYVWGPIVLVFSSIFIIHIVLGVMMLKNPQFMSPGGAPGRAAPPPPPAEMGWIFVVMGSGAVLVGWTLGILNIVSGRAIAQRKWRIFSLVISGINCLSVPLGTAIGVFTYIVLLRDSVRGLYRGELSSGPPVAMVQPQAYGQPYRS